jgi:hypothetical protein
MDEFGRDHARTGDELNSVRIGDEGGGGGSRCGRWESRQGSGVRGQGSGGERQMGDGRWKMGGRGQRSVVSRQSWDARWAGFCREEGGRPGRVFRKPTATGRARGQWPEVRGQEAKFFAHFVANFSEKLDNGGARSEGQWWLGRCGTSGSERIDDGEAVIVLAGVEVFGGNLAAAGGTGRLEDGGVRDGSVTLGGLDASLTICFASTVTVMFFTASR